MPDGTGDDYGSPGITALKQLNWDLSYVRDKLTLNNVSKTLVWQRSGYKHQMILGLIVVEQSSFLGAFRAMAAAIQAGEDGPAPVQDLGESSWSATQLLAMHDQLHMIASKLMAERKTFTMRMSGMGGSLVEMTLGELTKVSNASYRLAVKSLASQV